MMDVGQDLNPWPYVCLLAALLVMAPFFLKDLIPSGRPRNVKDKQSSSRDRRNSSGSRNSGRGNLCEVSGHDHPFRSSPSTVLLIHLPYAARWRFLLRNIRSVVNDRSSSRPPQVTPTHTAEELARGPVNRSANTRPAMTPANPRSAGTVDMDTPGSLPSFASYFLHR